MPVFYYKSSLISAVFGLSSGMGDGGNCLPLPLPLNLGLSESSFLSDNFLPKIQNLVCYPQFWGEIR